MDLSFLKYYDQARPIAQTNTILRLICSGYTDGLFNADVHCEIKNVNTGRTKSFNSADTILDFLYTRNPHTPIEICLHHDSTSTVFTDPNEMWLFLKPYIAAHTHVPLQSHNWDKAQYSMLCSINSEALSVANQLEFKERLNNTLDKNQTAWNWIVSKKDAGENIDNLLLQISSFNGGYNYPFSKLRRKISTNSELSQNEILKYFAEYGNTISIPLYALSKQHADSHHSEMAETYEAQIEHSYPKQYKAWEDSLRRQQLDPNDYVPLPIHPLNEDYVAQTLASWVKNKDVVKTTACIDTVATISTRTMKPQAQAMPYIKLSMPDIHLTSAARKLSHSSALVCGALTDIIQHAVTHDAYLSEHLKIIGEPGSIFFNPDKNTPYTTYTELAEKQSASMSVILRENPSTLVNDSEISVPLAGCFYGLGKNVKDGQLNKPLIVDIMRSAGVNNAATAKAYFRDYAHKIIDTEIGLFLRYGIALEPHQQNSYNVFDRQGHFAYRMIQDLADSAQIYRPVYEMTTERHDIIQKAISKLPYLERTFNYNPELDDPIRQLIHATFKSDLFPTAAMIAQEFGLTKTELMDVMRDEIGKTIQSARIDFSQTLPAVHVQPYLDFLDQAEKGLLHQPTLSKAFLTALVSGVHSGYADKITQPNSFQTQQNAFMI